MSFQYLFCMSWNLSLVTIRSPCKFLSECTIRSKSVISLFWPVWAYFSLFGPIWATLDMDFGQFGIIWRLWTQILAILGLFWILRTWILAILGLFLRRWTRIWLILGLFWGFGPIFGVRNPDFAQFPFEILGTDWKKSLTPPEILKWNSPYVFVEPCK